MAACWTKDIEEVERGLSCGVAAQSCQGGQGEEDVEVHFWLVCVEGCLVDDVK